MPGFLLIVFLILLNFQVYQILAICSNRQISKFNPDMPNDFNLVISPRPGIHYILIPNSKFTTGNPKKICPKGSSLTYIKSQEEWNDWKFIIGEIFNYQLSIMQVYRIYVTFTRP